MYFVFFSLFSVEKLKMSIDNEHRNAGHRESERERKIYVIKTKILWKNTQKNHKQQNRKLLLYMLSVRYGTQYKQFVLIYNSNES